QANRAESAPFDIVLNGKVADLDRSQLQEKLLPLIEAGATWWIEGLWDATEEVAVERIHGGPPSRQI
ncbi:MAG: LLM class flavin-dependent oxidoreductase, partial [Byssovorax cruenta]